MRRALCFLGLCNRLRSPPNQSETLPTEGAAGSVSQGDSPVGHTAGDVCGDDVSARYGFLVICFTDRMSASYQKFILRYNLTIKVF